ncbi:MAG: hypothetical protein K8H84_07815 [Sulfuricella denitrificans]|nr:hypothetical protein [Sulfuricella denitrificans]
MNERTLIMAALGISAGLLAWVYVKGTQGAARDLASGAVGAVNGVFVGGIEGVGQVFGIEPTNQTQCEKDKAAGKTWDASFSCPAGDFIKYLVG